MAVAKIATLNEVAKGGDSGINCVDAKDWWEEVWVEIEVVPVLCGGPVMSTKYLGSGDEASVGASDSDKETEVNSVKDDIKDDPLSFDRIINQENG
ncbi:hypothetical protein L1987_53360 [Smallanthus sonchifolius]|uniref:Uncharacterized protein n=1 Tax=Smallanthus sonchifolius TaxID=185202 RepID=A0ACB9EWH2_9ASTR|nr:hypothetical protein L1987_53360 [Smallanthus sonchifolius]